MKIRIVNGDIKVQYLRYARFLRISRTDNHSVLLGISQALILNFYRKPSRDGEHGAEVDYVGQWPQSPQHSATMFDLGA